MKIVQVNTVCEHGSIPKIMLNLYHHAKNMGHDCYIAYGRGNAPFGINAYKIGTPFDFICHVMQNFVKGESGFGSRRRTLKFLKWLDELRPDVIHLHNIHGFYLQIELLFEYIKKNNIRVVWTLHDCWTFTGQCAYFDYAGCRKWKSECHDCPIYRTSYPYSIFKDNSRNNYIRKKAAFSGVKNLTIITPSHWLMELVKESFLSSYPVVAIPNGVSFDNYHFLNKDKYSLRKQLKPFPVSASKKILLGVANVWDHRKGLVYFEKLLPFVENEWQIILIGLSARQICHFKKYPSNAILPLGHTSTQEELCLFYNIADIFINPTLEDNLPTTNLEALACGTPVITFDTGGSGECIDKNCGIVVHEKNTESLIDAIRTLENAAMIPEEISKKVLSSEQFARRYMEELLIEQK